MLITELILEFNGNSINATSASIDDGMAVGNREIKERRVTHNEGIRLVIIIAPSLMVVFMDSVEFAACAACAESFNVFIMDTNNTIMKIVIRTLQHAKAIEKAGVTEFPTSIHREFSIYFWERKYVIRTYRTLTEYTANIAIIDWW